MAQLTAQYVNPLLTGLKKLGGSARPPEVCDQIVQDLKLADGVLNETNKDGRPRYQNQIAWTRLFLVRTGYIDKSRRGVWTLTEKGRSARPLSDEEIVALLADAQLQDRLNSNRIRVASESSSFTGSVEGDEEAPEDIEESTEYRKELHELLLKLPPKGFERLCQRLLRESGFQEVTVTGRSGDGGIDGVGVLQVNPFVSFKVLFQCKRYANSVSSPHIRDFRGAMIGRADKGIIITTGSFTADAEREAVRDGVPPIELIDGFELVELFEQLELGLVPRTTYDLDRGFFEEFQK